MKAELLFKEKNVFEDGCIMEVVIWKLPKKTADRPHGLKYRLYYGDDKGKCLVRYDNESGKGDHKHIGDKEEPYFFQSPQKLMQDFLADIDYLTHKGGNDEKI